MATIPQVENPFVFDFSSSYGAVLLGAYISCAFWGINVMQACVSPAASSWFTLVQNWGRVSASTIVPQEPFHAVWVGYIMVAIVQLYYMRRIVKFASNTRHARRWWLWLCYFFFGGVFLLQFPMMTVYLSFTINRGVSNVLAGHSLSFSTTFVVAGLVIDSAIAVGMLILLRDASAVDRRAFSSSSAETIRRISVLVVNTGLLTVVINAIGLIIDVTNFELNMWAAVSQFPASSAYVSAFLANLNARRYVRGEGGTVAITNIEEVPQQSTSKISLTDSHFVLNIEKHSSTIDNCRVSAMTDLPMRSPSWESEDIIEIV
ncbi:hypothetical protein K488DRAFT_91583 [Vararia minispora EC-137]|uniref:Uncharacterized protein n=1 Tax=Vararia minispora EC-137 TaxID=1314806 RepID=A0ACB8Q5R9_9AGAM|nr:hypothetical protein K488DRAFT_91583 [Vararia minispora EC-137]